MENTLEKTSNPFNQLPDDALKETLDSLVAQDLVRLFKAVPSIRACASAKAAAQKALLNERMPGNSVADLIRQFSRWEIYQNLLKKALSELAPDASTEDHEYQAEASRKFLRMAIHQFTLRVAGAHSWYKHLPIGLDEKFVFSLNLTVNMDRSGGEFTKVKKDDRGFHYTWLPTDKYREMYGFFDYTRLPEPRHQENDDWYNNAKLPNSYQVVHDLHGREYITPHSMCAPAVDVTAAIHSSSTYHNLYDAVLNEAVRQQRPDLLKGDLKHVQRRFRYRQGLKLPPEVAEELETIALARVAGEDPSLSASRVLVARQIRERRAVALSLRKLCLQNFGEEWTPTEEEVVSFLPA